MGQRCAFICKPVNMTSTARYHYNAVNFLQTPHNRHIARGKGCLLLWSNIWFSLIVIAVSYVIRDKLDCSKAALDCIKYVEYVNVGKYQEKLTQPVDTLILLPSLICRFPANITIPSRLHWVSRYHSTQFIFVPHIVCEQITGKHSSWTIC